MPRWLTIALGATLAWSITSVSADAALANVPDAAGESIAENANATTLTELDEADEPAGRPDDPPAHDPFPQHPSTILENLRAPIPLDSRGARSRTSVTANRVVGTVLAVGGPAVVADETLSAMGWVTDRSPQRSGGQDRYETAVALSADHFPDEAGEVWLATGQNFPDGLTASSIAGSGRGPVLLTRTHTLPASVSDELRRLNPDKIWIVGGPGAVSDGVMQLVTALLPDASVQRRAGIDRYETAAALAAEFGAAPAVFIATGADFPDALSAAPAAARAGAPTLLVTATRVPAATEAQLRRLRPEVVYVVGGTGVISDAVASRIRAVTGGRIERVAGANRYETAAAVAGRFFAATTPSVVLATGADFPDSIAAGVVAGLKSSPLLLIDAARTPPRATTDAARRVSWWRPESGKVVRYVLITHPDDEFAAWSLIGTRDPRVYDVFVLLTTGESTRYCTGLPVSNRWSSQQFVPQPQPTGTQYSDRCKQHRFDSWTRFAESSGVGPFGTPERLSGSPQTFQGRTIPVPLGRDEAGAVVPASDYTVMTGADSAVVRFDLGALTSDEVLWAVLTTRALADRFGVEAEGDIIGAGYFNDAPTGYANVHDDHLAVHTLLRDTDLGLPGSQYATVGHAQSARAFGASVRDYCAFMCHPAAPGGLAGAMGRFQYAYGWLGAGYWQPGLVDAPAGFSEYQSFAKWH